VARLRSGGKKKEKAETAGPEQPGITDLERRCSDDKEVCAALQQTMFYDPRKIPTSLDEAAKKAAGFEAEGDKQQARMWYHIAGGLALWKSDPAKVKQYFGKCADLAPDMGYKAIVRMPERAVQKAQEFYKEQLK
jgi:hypothetical protein